MCGGTFQKGEPHESHREKDGESWDPSWRSFWIAQEVTKSWGLSLRNEWLIIRWLVIRFCLLLQTTSLTFSFFFFNYFLQIDPKVAFPRRAQPKVSRRAMDGILAGLSSFKPSIGNCWRLALVPSGCQQREVKKPRWAVLWGDPAPPCQHATVGSKHPAGERGKYDPSLLLRRARPRLPQYLFECSIYFKARLISYQEKLNISWCLSVEGLLLRPFNLEHLEKSRI